MENLCQIEGESNHPPGEKEEGLLKVININVPENGDETSNELEKDPTFIKCFNFVMKVSKRLSNPNKYIEFLRHLSNYSYGYINKVELGMVVVHSIGNYMDLMKDFSALLRELDKVDVKAKKKENKRKRVQFQEEAEEVKLISCKERPPALLFNKLLRGESSHETGDCMAQSHIPPSNPSIQTNYRSEQQRLKQQKLRFLVEDEMNEVDVLMLWLKGAREFVESPEGRYGYDETFGSIKQTLFKRCVERMYGDHAEHVLDLFKQNPNCVSSILLTQLRKKEEELKDYRDRMVPIWRRKRAGLLR